MYVWIIQDASQEVFQTLGYSHSKVCNQEQSITSNVP